jgi:hypothetical protein
MAYERQTDEALEKLAWDAIGGRVWGPWNGESYLDSFTILVLLGQEHRDQMKADNIAAFYEYLSKAGPLAVNDQPMFMSMKMLDKDDLKRLIGRMIAVEGIKNNRVADTKEEVNNG